MVEYITYKGKEYPFRISYYVQKKIRSEKEVNTDQITDDNVEIYEDILWYSLQAGHHVMDQELDLKREDMEFVLDECFQDFITKIPNFSQGMADGMNQAMDKVQEVQEKQNRQQRRKTTKKK